MSVSFLQYSPYLWGPLVVRPKGNHRRLRHWSLVLWGETVEGYSMVVGDFRGKPAF